jgi:hypothetical protein
MKNPEPEPPGLVAHRFLTHINYKKRIDVCCFKLLSLGLICYTIESLNKNTRREEQQIQESCSGLF